MHTPGCVCMGVATDNLHVGQRNQGDNPHKMLSALTNRLVTRMEHEIEVGLLPGPHQLLPPSVPVLTLPSQIRLQIVPLLSMGSHQWSLRKLVVL